jgi:hypothetical protein
VPVSVVASGIGIGVELGRLLPDGIGIGPAFEPIAPGERLPIEIRGISIRPDRSSNLNRSRWNAMLAGPPSRTTKRRSNGRCTAHAPWSSNAGTIALGSTLTLTACDAAGTVSAVESACPQPTETAAAERRTTSTYNR